MQIPSFPDVRAQCNAIWEQIYTAKVNAEDCVILVNRYFYQCLCYHNASAVSFGFRINLATGKATLLGCEVLVLPMEQEWRVLAKLDARRL